MDSLISSAAQVLAAIFATAWLYGSASEHKKARFKAWIAGTITQSTPLLKRILWASIGWAIFAGCILIVIYSSWSVYGFLKSTAPMSRIEVFHLLLNSFNGFMYLLVAAACWGLMSRKRDSLEPANEYQLLLEESQRFTLMLAEASDHQIAIEKIRNGEARFRIDKIAEGKVHLSLELPEGLTVSRV